MFSSTESREDVTETLGAVRGAEDVVDAGHDGGDVSDVAAVIHGRYEKKTFYLIKIISCYNYNFKC